MPYKDPKTEKQYQRDYYAEHRAHILGIRKKAGAIKWRTWNLGRNHGITVEDYDRMLAEQGGGCAICGSKTSGRKGHLHFYVDHDHKTGAIRGLLCFRCNAALGLFKDSPLFLIRAAQYLLKALLAISP
jgi:hypothetical protein